MRSRLVIVGIILATACVGHRVLLRDEPVSAQPPAKKDDAVEKVIVPFVTKHCVGCHGPTKKKADLALHTYKDDKAILKDRKAWLSVLQMIQAGEMPPQERPQPKLEEAEAFAKAVQGVFDNHDRNAPRDPGRVTMRRLNRTEYTNTIRDLVGVDFQATEDFPADDVGYGFDNIGDVLTISPVLMERYLAAAETITQRAILTGPPPRPAERPTIAIFLQPQERPLNERTRFRKLTTNSASLGYPYKLTEEGEYRARARVYGQQVGKEPVKFALLMNGKQVKTFEVKETSEKGAKYYETVVKLPPGEARLTVKLLNEFRDEEVKDKDRQQRTLFVQQIQLVGPLDPRPPSHRKILAHKEGAAPEDATREILQRFVSRAFRRPATKDEVDRLVKLTQKAEKAGEKYEASIQLALQAVLCSPKFLFRVELDDRPDSKDAHPIDNYQLASRLSYFLWSSMPDEELLALAARKQLHANLEAQVKRMMKDPKSSALVHNFSSQWLQLRILKNAAPDTKLFKDFDEELRSSMMKETELFFDAIARENRSILQLIDADFTFLNERLARHYGIADTNGNRMYEKAKTKPGTPIRGKEFVRVKLIDGERGGILTQASVLTVTSNPTRTSPVKRGRWVLEQVLGTPPPPPPPNVPELEEGDKAKLSGSLRERMEQHRKNPSCANCHARMDPIGFAFQNFDAIGKFRAKDGNFAIDPSGTLPGGRTFKGPNDLKKILMEKKDLFSRCVAEKMLTYAVGRGLEYYDRAAVDAIVAALGRNDYRFQTLVVEITKSDPFRMRRGKDQK